MILTTTLVRTPSIINSSRNKSEAHLKAALNLFNSASEQAEAGELRSAAILILKALDQERRAGGIGPQILQLIKPPT